MPDLTADELKAKIEQVKSDIKRFQQDGNSIRKMDILKEYQDYLEDELRNLENGLNRS